MHGSTVAQWKSACLQTVRPRVQASPASLHCGPWVRHIYPSLVLVQPRKTHPCLTERFLMWCKESNQTNKQNEHVFSFRLESTVDPDQMASSEAIRSGSTGFTIKDKFRYSMTSVNLDLQGFFFQKKKKKNFSKLDEFSFIFMQF